MRYYKQILTAAAALAAISTSASFGVRASAQTTPYIPPYTTWQPGWTTYHYDRKHVILGIVTSFTPYRLTIQRRNGMVQTIDLKNGTFILPRGATPTQGERAAVLGYFSNGTFIANRVILRG